MQVKLGDYEYAETEEQRTVLIEQTYQQLIGISISDHEPIFIERFSHGWISSGYTSPQFLVEQAKQAILMLRAPHRESRYVCYLLKPS